MIDEKLLLLLIGNGHFKEMGDRFAIIICMASKIKYWEMNEQLAKLRGYMRRGLSLKETAIKMGISPATLRQWIKESPTIRDNLKSFSSKADLYMIEDKLVAAAKRGGAWAITKYMGAFGGSDYNPELLGEFMPDAEDNSTFNEIVDIIEGEWKGEKYDNK